MTSTPQTNFSDLDRVLADVKIWKNDLRNTPTAMTLEELVAWTKNQLMHNVAAFFESQSKAVGGELADMGEALGELIDQEGDFLHSDTADDLAATFLIGMAIVNIIESENIVLDDELKNKKLRDAMKLYKNNTTILLKQIEDITNPEEEDEDDGTGASDVHGESGGAEELDGRGEGEVDEPGGADGDSDGSGAGSGSGSGTGAGAEDSEGEDEEGGEA